MIQSTCWKTCWDDYSDCASSDADGSGDSDEDDAGSFPSWAGILIGVVIVLLIILAVACCCYRCYQKAKRIKKAGEAIVEFSKTTNVEKGQNAASKLSKALED